MLQLSRIRSWAMIGLFLGSAVLLYGCSSAEDRARSYFDRGTELASKGEPVKATLEFRNALRLKPDYLDAQFALGTALEQQGDYANAVKSYAAVAEAAPTNVPARVRLSYIMLAAGQIDEASKFAEQASTTTPDDPTVLVARAAVALKRGNAKDAVDLANAALAKQPAYTEALVVLASERLIGSDPAGALKFLDQAPESSERDIGVQMMRLTALEAVGDEPGVEQLFNKLVEFFPKTPTLREGLTKWYLSKGRKDDAEAVVRKFVADNPGDEGAQLTLIAFLNSERGADAAAAELEAVIKARGAGPDAFVFRQALAQMRFAAGDQAGTVQLLEALVADTTDAKQKNQARMQLGRVLASENKKDEASALVETVLAEDARNVDALTLRASIRLFDGATAEATQDLIAALNEAPDNGNLHAALAQAYERSGSVVLAQEQYSKAADLNQYDPQTGIPMARFFLRYGKTDQAVRVLENVRRRTPDNRETLELLADLKLAMQDWGGAQEIADTLRKLNNGTDLTADRIGATALLGLNRYNDSISLLQGSLVNGDAPGEILPNLIAAYVGSGKPEVAEEYLNNLLAKDPANTEAQLLLASVHMTQGKTDLAEEGLKKAAANAAEVDGDIALAQFYWSRGDLPLAEAAANTGLAAQPESIPLGRMLAGIYERLGRFDDAIAQYEKLFERDPSSAAVANDLASLLSERRTDAASLQRAFEIAQRLSGSEIPQYLDTLGWIYHLRGDEVSALPLLKTAAERLPTVGLVQYHLGIALSGLGQKEAARASLQKALSAQPVLLEADRQKAEEALQRLDEKEATPDAQKAS